MSLIAPDTRFLDVEYLGRRKYIGCALLEGDRPALVDPGPDVGLDTLVQRLAGAGLDVGDLHAVLLTHIHLDHAGATGSLVRANPGLRVVVHRNGARHVVDPSRLLRSARRLYGDDMERLWGAVHPVPEENVHAVDGGEWIDVGGRTLEVEHTPGHASHHVSYFDSTSGLAFVGDTVGIRIDGDPYVLPVTPPPDIDLEAWRASLGRIEDWRPDRLLVTHFGPGDDAAAHLEQFRERLADWAATVRRQLDEEIPEDEAVRQFTDRVERDVEAHLSPDRVENYRQGGAPAMSWHGLARYWRRRRAAA